MAECWRSIELGQQAEVDFSASAQPPPDSKRVAAARTRRQHRAEVPRDWRQQTGCCIRVRSSAESIAMQLTFTGRPCAFLGACLVSMGCDHLKPASARAGSTSATAPLASDAHPAASEQPRGSAAADIDLPGVQNRLGCSGKQVRQACRVVRDFAQAQHWSAQMPSGQARWIGYAYRIEKGAEKRELMVVHAERVPTNQVGAGDLPIRIASGSLPEELELHGNKLVGALARGDVVTKKNRALPFVETFASNNQRGATDTAGTSVRLVSEENWYLRQQSPRKLLLVGPQNGSSDTAGDGVYAELWLATW